MRVFRTSYKDRDGKRRTASRWYVEFRDPRGAPRRLPAFVDKRASEEFGRKLQRLAQLRAAGEQPDAALSRWLADLPEKTRAKLARIGLLDSRSVAASKPLKTHLADYKQALLDKGTTKAHAVKTATLVEAILDGTGVVFQTDFTASAVSRYLAERRDKGLSIRTSNAYLTAAKAFGNWMVRERRASENLVAHLSKLNEKTDRRHVRRAFEPDELRRLIATTGDGPTRFGMTGPERATLYGLAAETGLRASELQSLTRASFALDGPEPTVSVSAAYAKNRRDDDLPLRSDAVVRLRRILSGKMPNAKAFDVPPSYRTAKMLRADLDDARAAWIQDAKTDDELRARESSDFLASKDKSGRVLDFHALRHSFISALAAGGVHPKTAQELARHSTISLTMDTYTHSARGSLVTAVESLPNLWQPGREAARATGTDDLSAVSDSVLASCLARNGTKPRESVQHDARMAASGEQPEASQNPSKTSENRDETTGRGGSRTRTSVSGQRILSPQRLPFRHSPNPGFVGYYATHEIMRIEDVL